VFGVAALLVFVAFLLKDCDTGTAYLKCSTSLTAWREDEDKDTALLQNASDYLTVDSLMYEKARIFHQPCLWQTFISHTLLLLTVNSCDVWDIKPNFWTLLTWVWWISNSIVSLLALQQNIGAVLSIWNCVLFIWLVIQFCVRWLCCCICTLFNGR